MRLALMRRATGRIEIASKEPPAWNGHIIESVSENTIFLVNLAKRLSRQQLLAGHIFFADLPAPLGVKRPDASIVNRKTEFDDLDAVADLAITHTADRSVQLGHD